MCNRNMFSLCLVCFSQVLFQENQQKIIMRENGPQFSSSEHMIIFCGLISTILCI